GGGQSEVTGNAKAGGTIANNLNVDGTKTPGTPSPPITFPPVRPPGPLSPVTECPPSDSSNPSSSPYSTSIPGVGTVPSGGALTISGTATITQNGTYCLSSLSVTSGGQLQVASGVSVRIIVAGTIMVTGGVINVNAGNATNNAVNLQLYSSLGTIVDP